MKIAAEENMLLSYVESLSDLSVILLRYEVYIGFNDLLPHLFILIPRVDDIDCECIASGKIRLAFA